ncbi:MAG: hypothetical protein HS130_07230 [Deltaproteobacteria bacterium]|nr:hypothetical protein [Deltaproteobacteria bacterium]MCL4872627.1 hypothetical protein [bacterium]
MKARRIIHQKVVEDSGNIVEVKLWQVPPSPDRPHGYKYSLVYIVDGDRVIGYDNAEGKRDHRHFGGKEKPYRFKDLRTLAKDFQNDIARWKATKEKKS